MANSGQCERRIVFADAAGVFAEAHIERPVEGVFNSPMAACIRKNTLGIRRIVRDVIARFGGGFSAGDACGGDAGDAAQARPAMHFLQPLGCVGRLATAHFDTAMALVGVFVRGQARCFRRLLEEQAHIRVQCALIALETKQILSAALPDLRGDLALAAHGVNGDSRPAQVQQAQQFGDRRDFIALLLRRRLRQDQPRFSGKRAHQMQGLGRPVMAAPQGLTVNGNQARMRFRQQLAYKGDEYLLKGLGVDGPEKPPQCIIAGNAVRNNSSFDAP